MDEQAITETVAQCLRGESGFIMTAAGFKVAELDMGEIYIRTPGGVHFRLIVETVSDDDIAGWGIDFDD